jgi:DNA-binding protein H-NS
MKNWKSLFIKTEEEDEKKDPTPAGGYTFPVNNNNTVLPGSTMPQNAAINQPALNEVLAVYEKGIDSINMPGYDFYEFYKAISTVGNAGTETYSMAFQMAKSMDSSISSHKLVTDAEFYISKINEVHSQYTSQGQQKINEIDSRRNEEKNKLMSEIEQGTSQINMLKNQLQALESEINQKRITLTGVDAKYSPQEASVREKLLANDNAKQISVSKLIAVKEGILKFIK